MKTKPLISTTYRFLGLSALTFCLVGFDQPRPEQAEFSSTSGSLVVPFSLSNDSKRTPIIEHALDQVDKINNISTLLGELNNNGTAVCEGCQKALANIRYMQCNQKNSYLEKELEEISQQGSPLMKRILNTPIRANSIIKPVCMRMSMESRFGISSKSFRSCEPGMNRTGVRTFRPCISENYFKITQNSFDLVSSCMKDFMNPTGSVNSQKLDVRAVYALINVESGFHVNATSETGAGGIGQFTSAAIADVNRNELSNLRSNLETNSSATCNHLSTEFLAGKAPMHSAKASSCERISLSKGNPVKNMLYTFAYLTNSRQNLEKVIFRNLNYVKKFNLSPEELDKVKRALMIWSHNTGTAGTWTPVKALLNTVYRKTKVTDANKFINEIQKYMQKFPASANTSRARRRETSNYFPAITNTLNQIETNAGAGSCVN